MLLRNTRVHLRGFTPARRASPIIQGQPWNPTGSLPPPVPPLTLPRPSLMGDHVAKTAAEKLAELEKQAAAIKARMQAIKSREQGAERKADTRRKIIVGGLLIAEAMGKPEAAAKLVRLIDAKVTRDVDKTALEPLVAELREVAAKQGVPA